MAHSYHEIAFTPTVLDLQREAGSRAAYAGMAGDQRYADTLSAREIEFITQRDSFYMASVSETGWPYLQHRGGPAGFMKVIDARTIGFADFSGNGQYISTGNFINDDRVSLFFMDYPNQRRLKMFGRVRTVDISEEAILTRLEDENYAAPIERGFLISIEGFDWNCPAHITPRFSEAQVRTALNTLEQQNRQLRRQLDEGNRQASANDEAIPVLGSGSLELVITGVRQLAPRVRADGTELPEIQAGAHLRVPVMLSDGQPSERYYSIASNPSRRDIYEIAVLREDRGRGGSTAIHAGFGIGTVLRVDAPANQFNLHADDRPGILIAGGIGITPIKSMAQALQERGSDFHLHYAGRSLEEMAYRDRLQHQFDDRISVYSSAQGQRLDLDAILAEAADDALIYVCGPDRLLNGVTEAAKRAGISRQRIRSERFS